MISRFVCQKQKLFHRSLLSKRGLLSNISHSCAGAPGAFLEAFEGTSQFIAEVPITPLIPPYIIILLVVILDVCVNFLAALMLSIFDIVELTSLRLYAEVRDVFCISCSHDVSVLREGLRMWSFKMCSIRRSILEEGTRTPIQFLQDRTLGGASYVE